MGPILLYLIKLGALGFGGPVALVNAMERDLVEKKRLVSEEDFRLGLALSQAAPGPLASQMSMWLGYLRGGWLGALVAGILFALPSFLIVLVISILYVKCQGLWWLQAWFKGVGPAVVCVIALAAWRLTKRTLARKRFLWSLFGVMLLVTAFTRAEIAGAFIGCGLLAIFFYARPKSWAPGGLGAAALLPVPPVSTGTWTATQKILLFYGKAGSFVFGTGLAIVPFLYKGVVQDNGWLSEAQFMDAVAVSLITPGPMLITVAFIGFLTLGWKGSVAACIGVFAPAYFFTVIPAPYFRRHKDNAQLIAFVEGITAAAVGALAGSVFLLVPIAIQSVAAAALAGACLILLIKLKWPEFVVVLLSGAAGLCIF